MTRYTEEDEQVKVLEYLVSYANLKKDFNRKYVDSIEEFFNKHGFVTLSQLEVLKKIYTQETGLIWDMKDD